MDSKGVIPESLRYILKNWKEKLIEHEIEFDENNVRAPKLFYTIPTGQNPTGIVIPVGRKKEIYKVSQSLSSLWRLSMLMPNDIAILAISGRVLWLVFLLL